MSRKMNKDTAQNSPLPFNPLSKEKSAEVVKITPQMAAYILQYHNNDNRKKVKSQTS